jgi:hypothetical protein
MRELGRMGPYVKVALEDARRDMDFCFEQARGAASGEAAIAADESARPSAPAVLLLYLQAREGALDVVDVRTDYLGTSSREVVDCCREVLRGREISAFNAVAGRRYRVKYELQ